MSRRPRLMILDIVQTLLRVLPFPCKTGLIRIGDPDRNAPVLLTCNFRLTVARVKRALEGIDAYLLVANSRGVNVWCAATGGLMTDHDVISALKTSGIEKLVDHRHVILPQLAATGIEGRVIREKTGWRVVWGPVYAKAIPTFLAAGNVATREMRAVSFPWPARLEMAVAWAFPISLLALPLLFFWPVGVLPVVGLIWAISLLVFLAFPLYMGRLRTAGKRAGLIFFDFGERGGPAALWILFLLSVAGYGLLTGDLSLSLMLRWGLVSLTVFLIVSLDLAGSTPVYKSGLHGDRLLRIELDAEACTGAGFCETVCPKDVIEVDHHRRLAALLRPEECVQCGACIVQCPFDALYFRGPDDTRVTPESVRRYKLNLMGKRLVDAGATAGRAGTSV